MNVAVLTPTFYRFSGIDRVVEMQVAELAKKHKVTVFCFEGDIHVRGVRVVRIHMPKHPLASRIYRLLFFLDIFKRKAVAGQLTAFDRVHVHFYPMSVLAHHAKLLRQDVEIIEHDYGVATPGLFSRLHERIYLRVFRKLSYRYMKSADKVVSISHYLAREAKRHGIDASVEHIRIDTKRFNRSAKGEAVRKRLGIDAAPMCFYVGRLSPHKGVHLLIEAYKLAKKRIPDLQLVIGGKATFAAYERTLRELAGGDKDIIFAGFVPDDDLPAYYAAATVYTTATRWEGFDMPIPEAAACGTPTVAFDVCAHPEVTKNGTLVKENDVSAFADAIVATVRASHTKK